MARGLIVITVPSAALTNDHGNPGERGYVRQGTQLPTGEAVFDAMVMLAATGRRAMEAAMPEVRATLDLALQARLVQSAA